MLGNGAEHIHGRCNSHVRFAIMLGLVELDDRRRCRLHCVIEQA